MNGSGNVERDRKKRWGGRAILAQAFPCFRGRGGCVIWSFLLSPWQAAHFMPRRGWSTMEVLSGWLQVIRGTEAPVGPMASCVRAASSECGESAAAAQAEPTQAEPQS